MCSILHISHSSQYYNFSHVHVMCDISVETNLCCYAVTHHTKQMQLTTNSVISY